MHAETSLTSGARISRRAAPAALAIGIAGLALSAAAAFIDGPRFFLAWQTGFVFWTTLALGALFFTMLQHLTAAVWSITVRRAAEAMSMSLPVLFFFFLPMLPGIHTLFHWSHADAVATDANLQWKAGYLNEGFFVARAVLFFSAWSVLAWFLNAHSRALDGSADPVHLQRLRSLSAGGMFVFAFTVTFASFDWLMSLTPHWYSTIFGVYVFVGGFLAWIAFMTVFYLLLRARGVLTEIVGMEHFHDFGRLLFAFTVFWAYIGGSQYFLIWYANIPEETVWFLARWDARSWRIISMSLITLHFAVPFLALATYRAKRSLAVLAAIAALLLLMHFVDMYWLVYPSRFAAIRPSWIDVMPCLGIGGIVLFVFLRRFESRPPVPLHDPRLADSISHRV